MTRPVIVPNETGTCTVSGCDKAVKGRRNLCAMHEARIRRHGNASIVKSPTIYRGEAHYKWTGGNASYAAVHLRLRKHRGKPTECAFCGTRSKRKRFHWAFDWRACNDVRIASDSEKAPGAPYCTHVEHYMALCVPCHKRFDLSRQ